MLATADSRTTLVAQFAKPAHAKPAMNVRQSVRSCVRLLKQIRGRKSLAVRVPIISGRSMPARRTRWKQSRKSFTRNSNGLRTGDRSTATRMAKRRESRNWFREFWPVLLLRHAHHKANQFPEDAEHEHAGPSRLGMGLCGSFGRLSFRRTS